MKRFVGFCVKHPVSVISLLCAILLCSLVSLFTIQFDILPKIDERFLLVSTEYMGLSADEMKILVTQPIEDSLTSLKGLKNITSVTRNGLSLVTVELHWNVNVNVALTECKSLADECYEMLPSNCSKPEVKIFNPKRKASFVVSVKPSDADLQYARFIAEKNFKNRFQKIKGVSSVMVYGGEKEEIKVILDKDKAERSHLSLENVSNQLAMSNFEYPSGKIQEGNKEYSFKTSGLFSSKEDILEVSLFQSETSSIKVSDIAKVEKGVKRRDSFFLEKNSEAVCIEIFRKNDSSPISLSKQINEEIGKLNENYGTFYEFSLLYDESKDLKSSILFLLLSAGVGCVVTVILLLFFFRSFRAAFLVSSIIPLSVLFSVLVLNCCGSSINVMSLSGIAVGIGMVIDTTIVAFEAFTKKISEKSSLEDAVIEGVSGVSFSSASSSLTTIIVFLPLFFISGLSSLLFRDMAISVISSIAFSCLLSLSFIPAMISLVYKKSAYKDFRELKFEKIERIYFKVLNFSFEKQWIVPLVISVSLVFSVILVFVLPKEILPKTFSREVVVKIKFPENTSMDYCLDSAKLICAELEKMKEIENFYAKGGVTSKDYLSFADEAKIPESLEIYCTTNLPKKLKKNLERCLSRTNLEYKIQDAADVLSSVLAIENNCYIVKSNALETSEGVIIVPDSKVENYVFYPDRLAMSKYTVSAVKCAQLIYDSLEGNYSASIFKEGREIPVLVCYPKNSISSVEQLENLLVECPSGYVPLKVLGKIEKIQKEKVLFRYSKSDAKKIFIEDESYLNKIEEFKPISVADLQLKELFSDSVSLIVIILLLLYCVMGAQFQSFTIPLLIMTSIVPCFFGEFVFLFIFGQSINLNSVIALIVLFGTSVNNAIILYESIKESQNTESFQQPLSKSLVITSSVKKLRPIIITSMTSVFALVPFAFDPLKMNAQSSMAIAIIGGLLFSLFAVLIIMPKMLFFGMLEGHKK